MADRTTAEILIGGTIPATLIGALCQAIAAEGLAQDWGGPCFEPASADELLEACTGRDGINVLWLCDDQALSGQFGCLEDFLQQHGIAFRRQCGATCESDPEIVEFRPGIGRVVIPTNTAGEPVVAIACIRAVEAKLAEAIELVARGDRRSLATLRSAKKLLLKHLPPQFPRLAPLEISQLT